jgi:hypothetical protein
MVQEGCVSGVRGSIISPLSDLVHICPSFCHYCPEMGGDVMPECYGTLENRPLSSCTCENLVCEICGAPGARDSAGWYLRCSWPDERFITVRYDELIVGDRVRRATERLKGRSPAIVESIDAYGSDQFKICLRIGKRIKRVYVLRKSPVRASRIMACGAPVCENHCREVDDGVVYCSNHWKAWETVAA